MDFLVSTVPSPLTQVSGLPNGSLYTGTNLTLVCNIEIGEWVDTPVVVIGTWKRGGETLSTDARHHISPIASISSLQYWTSISISPLSSNMDTGHYTCEVIIRPHPPLPSILSSRASTTVEVTVNGKVTAYL